MQKKKPQKTLLIVEDDPTCAEILNINLTNKHYNLTFVTNGQAAYDAALKQLPDLILMDIKMPGWDGFETCKVFKSDKTLVNIPIIFVTSALNEIKKAFAVGGADYVIKPLNPTELDMRIGFHLQRMEFETELKQLNKEFNRTIQQQTAELTSTNRRLEQALAELKILQEK